MNQEIRSLYKLIKITETEESTVELLDTIIKMHEDITPDWTQWYIVEFIKNCEQYKNRNKWAIEYARQFVWYLMQKYIDLPKEERSVDMFSALLSAVFSFKDDTNLYKLFFRADEFITDWLVTNDNDLETNFMIEEIVSDKYLIMKNTLESGTKHLNTKIFEEVENMSKELELFIGLKKRIEDIKKASLIGMEPKEVRDIIRNGGHPELLYYANPMFYQNKFDNAPEDMKPTKGWYNLLENGTASNIEWAINNVMKYAVADLKKPLGKKYLAKIFRYKRCQSYLYNHKDYSYAIPDMIEFARGRVNHDTLCVEFKDILGYLDDVKID